MEANSVVPIAKAPTDSAKRTSAGCALWDWLPMTSSMLQCKMTEVRQMGRVTAMVKAAYV